MNDVREIHDVCAELLKARHDHCDMNSPHEGYAILLEEVHELWDEVRRKDDQHDLARMRTEALQVAAVAIKLVMHVDGKQDGGDQ